MMNRIVLATCVLLAGNAFAQAQSGPTEVVMQFLASFNAGDVDGAAATNAIDVVIVDELPPYQWQGEGAFGRWLADLGKHDEAAGVSNGHMAVGKTVREEIGPNSAYIVLSTVYQFLQNGTAMEAPGHMTFALRLGADGWRISAWTYSAPAGSPVG